MKRKLFCLCIFFFLIAARMAWGQTTSKSPALTALENGIRELQKDEDLRNASWSVCVTDIKSGSDIAACNADLSLVPASVMKIVTTASALVFLDSSFTFETRLQYSGMIDKATGTLRGNIYLTGGGDPTLGSRRFGAEVSVDTVFSRFVRALTGMGIRRIEGYIIGDESIFDEMNPRSWSWEDIGNYYGSGACGLSVNENMYRLYFDSGAKDGDTAILRRTEPPMPEIKFINRVMTSSATKSDEVYVLGAPFVYLRVLDGSMPAGKTDFDVDGSIPDPALYCTRIFREFAEARGITAAKGHTTIRAERWKGAAGLSDTARRTDICVYRSPSLGRIMYYTNLKSVNMFAEAMLKMIGRKKSGEGSAAAGIKAIRSYWSSYAGLEGFEMKDGSGLSRKNLVTAKQLSRILAHFYSNPEFSTFFHSLPVAGKSGILKNYLKGTFAEGRLHAKTGNMDVVSSYAGYVTSRSGRELAFAIILNNYSCPEWAIKQKSERLMQLISEL